MAATTTETVGFCDQFNQLIQNNKDLLKEKGLDVSNWITDTTTLKNDVLTKSAERDSLKAASKVKTKELNTASNVAYKTTSTRLDAVIGVLGKDTPAAKEAARLRSSLITHTKKSTNNQNNS